MGSADDLVTTHSERRAGFVALALERSRHSTPIVQEARALYYLAASLKNPKELLRQRGIRDSLLTAAGISDKAMNHLLDSDKREAIRHLIEEFLEPAGDKFPEELVYRFLLTRGDSLGGAMRNLAGALAQARLIRSIMSWLSIHNVKFFRQSNSNDRKWESCDPSAPNIESSTAGLAWQIGNRVRTLQFNIRVPSVRNNVDLVLLAVEPSEVDRKLLNDQSIYLAMGELKGGIDPAGADEHWKTAKSAFERIRTAFASAPQMPHLFFIGAAIEQRMAEEIWDWLNQRQLSRAANLNKDPQLAGLCRWLVSL